MGHLRRVAVALTFLALALGGGTTPAGADCMGPTIAYAPIEVVPGEVVEVFGTGWGDNCYDTGPPPAGEGVLGRPVDHIEVVVSQGDSEEIVAVGAADAEYEFVVEVPIPSWVGPGEAWISARGPWGEAAHQTAQPFVVIEGEPLAGPEIPVEFGPTGDDPAEGAAPGDDTGGARGGSGPSLTVVVTAAMACVALGVVVLLRPRTAVTTSEADADPDAPSEDQVRGR